MVYREKCAPRQNPLGFQKEQKRRAVDSPVAYSQPHNSMASHASTKTIFCSYLT